MVVAVLLLGNASMWASAAVRRPLRVCIAGGIANIAASISFQS